MAAVTVQGYCHGWLVCVTGGRCLPVSDRQNIISGSWYKQLFRQVKLVYSQTRHIVMVTGVWTGVAFGLLKDDT